jgi:hypothetical protein
MPEDRRPITNLIPPVLENVEYFDCSPLRFSVERRVLSPEIISAQYAAVHDGEKPPENWLKSDGGGSLHIEAPFGDAQWTEHLRFDCFDDQPHYHYLCPSEGWHERYAYDEVANGRMISWVLETLSNNLTPMLTQCKAEKVVLDGIDRDRVTKILRQIEQAWVLVTV